MQTCPSSNLLDVENLCVHFHTDEGLVRAVDGVSFRVANGEMVALVGESGCGKSVTAMSLARLIPSSPGVVTTGKILLDGQDVLNLAETALRRLRGAQIACIFQEPAGSLNPVFRIGFQLREALAIHGSGAAEDEEIARLLKRVGLMEVERVVQAYPHELSGGMQQRVMIAMALASRPRLLVADEPTTALDVTVQAQVLHLLRSLQRDLGMAVLFITHNLGLVAEYADRVYVMYAGRIMESGPVERVLARPAHPYTRGLLEAVPRLEGAVGSLKGIEGSVPSPAHWPKGCAFHPRCAWREALCETDEPSSSQVDPDRGVRCHLWKSISSIPMGCGVVE
ncbi:MAG: ABC transporter ATP-binding protein [Lentisphaerota bacterium]